MHLHALTPVNSIAIDLMISVTGAGRGHAYALLYDRSTSITLHTSHRERLHSQVRLTLSIGHGIGLAAIDSYCQSTGTRTRSYCTRHLQRANSRSKTGQISEIWRRRTSMQSTTIKRRSECAITKIQGKLQTNIVEIRPAQPAERRLHR